jgi:transposase
MRQQHRAGERLFVDFSGKRLHLVDRRTGEEIPIELFVGVLGASCYTYAEATLSQKLPDWIGVHTRMLEYFGGSPAIWVPDQLKSGVTGSCRYV